MGSASDIVRGEIVRFSGSGNAMLETTENGEFNLGPLPEDIEGEVVRALLLSGPWALCLEPGYINDNYLSKMSDRSGRSLSKETFRAYLGDTASEDDVGRLVKTSYTTTERFSKYDDGKPISVHCPGFLGDIGITHRHPVRIVAIRDGIAVGVPALDMLDTDKLAISDKITLTVQRTPTDGPGLVGTTKNEGYPAVINDIVGHQGASVRASVTDVFATHLEAQVGALPDEAWPKEGSLIDVNIHRVGDDGVAIGTANGLPVELPQARDCVESVTQFSAAVVKRMNNRLIVGVDEIPENERPVVGDTTQCQVIHSDSDGTLCRTDDVLVWITGSVPKPINSFKCSITDITQPHLVGSVTECPSVQSLTPGDEIIVQIEHRKEGAGVGRYENIPVIIPNGKELIGHNVRLGVEEIDDGHITARFDALADLPEENTEITLSEETVASRDGRICLVNSAPVILPRGSNWSSSEIRVGIEAIIPQGIQVSVDALPPESRPQIGDEIEINSATALIESDFAIKNGIPIRLPSYQSGFEGPIRLGVSGVQLNCVRCSVPGLSDLTLPAVGETVQICIDSRTDRGSRGRVDGIPSFLPRAEIPPGETRRMLIVTISEAELIGVEIETDQYAFGLDSDTITTYYNSLSAAREAWQSDDFEQATEHCETAAQQIGGGSPARKALKLDAERQALLLETERIRRDQDSQAAGRHIKSELKSIDLPDVPGAEAVREELDAYRLLVEGLDDGSVSRGLFVGTIRKLTEIKNMDDNPWRTISPHPIFGTVLATIRPPNVPAADKVDRFIRDTPEYWPFLTLSRLP